MPSGMAQVIAITGASGGIGSALAAAYAEAGVTFGLFGRDPKKLENTARACRDQGAKAIVCIADLTMEAEMRDALTAFDEDHKIDLFFANAGVTAGRAREEILEPWDRARAAAEVNFLGTMHSVSVVAALMLRRGRGQIAVIGSLGAWRGLPSSPAYCAAKAGIETYGQALRAGLAGQGIRVSVISPGFVETDMSRKLSGAKPFTISAGKAAAIIKRRLVGNPARISFPFPLNLGARILALLPDRLARLILPAFAFTVRHPEG